MHTPAQLHSIAAKPRQQHATSLSGTGEVHFEVRRTHLKNPIDWAKVRWQGC